ncbi:MAG: 30S ribosomal protein S9 [Opitutae bacterium]|jgi:small subunit ribosomal protein S9|nr:30S ribosomal protein S9 [Opitutae bacterium]|tara:strand:+ start:4431 stop:4835 length:405 start_codon:yes stop_codon:yes gene_type:complete
MSAKAKSVEFIGTGRRKTSTARVRIKEGTGIFVINGRDLADYCKTEQQRKTAFSPLATVEKASSVDVSVNVSGGGGVGQAGAIRHGLSRALEKMDSELRVPLKRAGHLRRDPRKIERKKTGQPGARKRFQFSKR